MGPVGSVVLYNTVVSDVTPFMPQIAGEVSDPFGDKRPTASAGVDGFRVATLLRTLLAKNVDDVLPSADTAALAKFLECNAKCELEVQPVTDIDHILLGEYRSSLSDFFLYYDNTEGAWYDLPIDRKVILNHARHGPGAAQGAKEVSAYAKHCSSKLTATSQFLLDIFEEDSFSFETSGEAQLMRSAVYGEEIVDGNILAFVPKKRTISRVTCTEASVNMYLQLGLGSVFEQHLDRRYSINFRGRIDDSVQRFIAGDPLFSKSRGKFLPSQAEFNAYLARKGSLDGSYATIDLVSASDTISMRRLADCPNAVRRWVKALRSEVVTLPDGQAVQLNMISTMGNGFTFALQTILFSAAVNAVYRVLGIPFIRRSRHASADYYGTNRGNWGVFGDDIVVVAQAYQPLCQLLGLLGFEVNTEKSFNDGPFRESCGSDWFTGHFVRGIYIKSLRTSQDKLVAFNRLAYWSAYTGVPLNNTLKLLYEWIPPADRLRVPLHEDDAAGLKVPKAWKHDLGVQATSAFSKWGEFVPVKLNARLRKRPSVQAPRYECFRDVGLKYRLHDVVSSALSFRKRGKWVTLLVNNAGVLWSTLGNWLRDGEASSRLTEPRYTKTSSYSSGWDYTTRPPGSLKPLVGPDELTFVLSPVMGETRG